MFNQQMTFRVQKTAATCSAVSMVTTFIVFYWFCRMEKRFRHRLIMLLVLGDLIKASVLFAFAIVSIASGTVGSSSLFCQASGFLLQYGLETSDYSVLAIAIHSAIQVFRPSAFVSSDGLYPYRFYVYIGAFLIPGFMSSMAFVNPHIGYQSVGPFCTLPVRPIWYCLALTWIPRYLIAIIILGLAVAIYTHVGLEFRNFTQTELSAKTHPSKVTPTSPACALEEARDSEASKATEQKMQTSSRRSSVIDEVVSPRRASAVAFILDENVDSRPRSQSVPVSLPGLLPPLILPLPSTQTLETTLRTAKPSPTHNDTPCSIPSRTYSRNRSLLSTGTISNHRPQLRERARIHRQLRLMFIYPVNYIIMWIIPFVSHCMKYRDKWAVHPVYMIYLLSTVCYCLMAFADCVVFSLRERPWKHMVGSDGTFVGSFFWWKHIMGDVVRERRRESDAESRVSSTHNSAPSRRGRRTTSVQMGRKEDWGGDTRSLMVSITGRKNQGGEIVAGSRETARARLEAEVLERRADNLRREVEIQERERGNDDVDDHHHDGDGDGDKIVPGGD